MSTEPKIFVLLLPLSGGPVFVLSSHVAAQPAEEGAGAGRSPAVDAAMGTPPDGAAPDPDSTDNAGYADEGATTTKIDQTYGPSRQTVQPDGTVVNGLTVTDPSLYGQDQSGLVEEVPDYHIVQSGDTLWDISGYYLTDPYLWPKVWSWNEHVTNAHWIFPGDRIRLYDPTRDRGGRKSPSMKFRRTELPPGRAEGTYLLDQVAFVDAEAFETSMKIIGGGEATVMMASLDTVYMSYDKGNPPIPGERLIAYAPTREVKRVDEKGRSRETVGYLVQIMGEVEVDSVATKAAEGTVMNSVNPVERGYRVGPLRRVYRRIETKDSERSASGLVLTTLNASGPIPIKTKNPRRGRDPDLLAGEEQFCVTDLGTKDGVQVGNILEVVRKGDEYTKKRVLAIPYEEGWPRRVIGALLVVEANEETSLAVSVYSRREFERGDHVELRGAGLGPVTEEELAEDEASKREHEADGDVEVQGGKAKGSGGFGLGGK
jgi:hypothetical protein